MQDEETIHIQTDQEQVGGAFRPCCCSASAGRGRFLFFFLFGRKYQWDVSYAQDQLKRNKTNNSEYHDIVSCLFVFFVPSILEIAPCPHSACLAPNSSHDLRPARSHACMVTSRDKLSTWKRPIIPNPRTPPIMRASSRAHHERPPSRICRKQPQGKNHR